MLTLEDLTPSRCWWTTAPWPTTIPTNWTVVQIGNPLDEVPSSDLPEKPESRQKRGSATTLDSGNMVAGSAELVVPAAHQNQLPVLLTIRAAAGQSSSNSPILRQQRNPILQAYARRPAQSHSVSC